VVDDDVGHRRVGGWSARADGTVRASPHNAGDNGRHGHRADVGGRGTGVHLAGDVCGGGSLIGVAEHQRQAAECGRIAAGRPLQSDPKLQVRLTAAHPDQAAAVLVVTHRIEGFWVFHPVAPATADEAEPGLQAQLGVSWQVGAPRGHDVGGGAQGRVNHVRDVHATELALGQGDPGLSGSHSLQAAVGGHKVRLQLSFL